MRPKELEIKNHKTIFCTKQKNYGFLQQLYPFHKLFSVIPDCGVFIFVKKAIYRKGEKRRT